MNFTGITAYLYAGVAAIILALSVTIVIQHLKITAKNSEIKAVTTELSITNQSNKNLTKAIKDINDQLQTAQTAEIKKQATIDAQLKAAEETNKSLQQLQYDLDHRKSTSNCPVPKDLKDAWNSL